MASGTLKKLNVGPVNTVMFPKTYSLAANQSTEIGRITIPKGIYLIQLYGQFDADELTANRIEANIAGVGTQVAKGQQYPKFNVTTIYEARSESNTVLATIFTTSARSGSFAHLTCSYIKLGE